MPTSRKTGTTTKDQPVPMATPMAMTTGTVTERSIDTSVERVSRMRASTPPLTETAELTCPSSRPQPRPMPAAPRSDTAKTGAQASSRPSGEAQGEGREVGDAHAEPKVEPVAEQAGRDHAHGQR